MLLAPGWAICIEGWTMEGKMIDPELLTFLTNMENKFIGAVKESEKHIKETLKLTIDPVKDELKTHKKGIDDLYNKDRENRDRFGKIEGRVNTLEEDKKDNDISKEMKLVTIGIIVTAIIGIVAIIISIS